MIPSLFAVRETSHFCFLRTALHPSAWVHSWPSQGSKMKLFLKTVNCLKLMLLTFFAKGFIADA